LEAASALNQVSEELPALVVESGKSLSGPARSEQTNTFFLTWNPVTIHVTDLNLLGASVKIYSNDYPPPPIAPSADTQKLNDNVDQIREIITNLNSSTIK